MIPGARGGELRELPLPGGETRARAVTQKALTALVLSATPGSYLVDSPEDRDLVVHGLGPPGPLERAVRR